MTIDHAQRRLAAIERQHLRIDHQRKAFIDTLAKDVHQLYKKNNSVNVTFECGMNSRRSQIAELLFAASVIYYGMDAYSFSSTSVGNNPLSEMKGTYCEAVNALMRFGFPVLKASAADASNYVQYVLFSLSDPVRVTKSLSSKGVGDLSVPKRSSVTVVLCDKQKDLTFNTETNRYYLLVS